MTNKTTKKGKKPLQTTLGKACLNDREEIDLSHVRRPIDTSIFGLRHVLTLFQTATEEVKNYITYECDIMYECRICKTIYRSLANFILHKRNYCREKYIPSVPISRNCGIQDYAHPPRSPEGTNIIESRSLRTPEPTEKNDQVANKGLSPVIEKLKEKQEINRLTSEILSKDLSNEKPNQPMSCPLPNRNLLLEEIATNNAAVFQTVLQSMSSEDLRNPEFMKSEVMEIHGILDSDEAVLGADGKICNFQTNKINRSPILPKIELSCTECNLKFSTKKTLVCHLRNKHNNSRLVYVCPDCKETYANAWGVYRHLYKVHRKTSAQVKRLRQQVHNSIVRKDEEPHKKNEKKDADKADKTDEENQWLNNIEGDKDFQMCGGCGKRFERKAALHSHAQMCTKRIAVCNTIKENNAKKKEEESKDIKTKQSKIDKPLPFEAPLKGASKRKPLLLRTYKTVGGTASSFQTQNNCDVNANTELGETVCDNKDPTVIVDGTKFNKKATNSPSSRLEDTGRFEKNKECVCSEGKVNTTKLLSTISVAPNEPNEVIKRESLVATPESSRCHTTDDFDLFCEKVAERIRQTGLSDMEKSHATSLAPLTANTVPETAHEENNLLRDEDELQRNTSLDVSPCRISIRSMEDLIGFPKEQEEIVRDQEISESDVIQNACSVVPGVPKTAVSPKIRRSPRRPSKRKRTASLDSAKNNKVLKKCDFDSLIDKQDIGFTTKAAPYMDRKNLTCKTCRLTFPTFSKLLCHMSTHFSWYRFQCSRCSFITFSKSDCADHAKTKHDAAESEISSIVLPIPNWKTVLMSNEFRELEDDPKHRKETNDTQKWGQKEATLEGEKVLNDNIINTLFVDSDSTEVSADIDTFPLPMVKNLTCIKNESIDIVDTHDDSFQLEVPQEIYTLDAFEVIHIDDSDDDRYNFRTECNVKTEVADNDDFVVLNSPGIAELDEESEEQTVDCTVEVLEDVVPKDDEFKVTDPAINLRPTRNRVRSIKTLQNDFFYDLGKVIKLNESVVNKTSGPQKQKKNAGSANAKKEKGIKVYSNKQ